MKVSYRQTKHKRRPTPPVVKPAPMIQDYIQPINSHRGTIKRTNTPKPHESITH